MNVTCLRFVLTLFFSVIGIAPQRLLGCDECVVSVYN